MKNTLYKQEIIDHYKNPRNFGAVGEVRKMTWHVDVANVSCGDELSMGLEVADGKVEDVRIFARGCAISVASASILSEKVKGQTVEKLKGFTVEDVLSLVNMQKTSPRVKCGLLSYEALKELLKMLQLNNGKAKKD